MPEKVRILCVDDERNVLRALQRLFLDDEYELLTATSAGEGLEILAREREVQVVISDYRMPGLNGVEFLREVCRRWPETVRLVLSGYADTAAVVAAVNDGEIYKFIPKPWNDDELRATLANALEKYFLAKKNRELLGQLQASKESLSCMNERLEAMVDQRLATLVGENRRLALAGEVLEKLPLPVLAYDAEGRRVFYNRAAASLSAADLSGIVAAGGAASVTVDGINYRVWRSSPEAEAALKVVVLGPKGKIDDRDNPLGRR